MPSISEVGQLPSPPVSRRSETEWSLIHSVSTLPVDCPVATALIDVQPAPGDARFITPRRCRAVTVSPKHASDSCTTAGAGWCGVALTSGWCAPSCHSLLHRAASLWPIALLSHAMASHSQQQQQPQQQSPPQQMQPHPQQPMQQMQGPPSSSHQPPASSSSSHHQQHPLVPSSQPTLHPRPPLLPPPAPLIPPPPHLPPPPLLLVRVAQSPLRVPT